MKMRGKEDLERLIDKIGVLKHHFVPGTLYRIQAPMWTFGRTSLEKDMIVMYVDHFFKHDVVWQLRTRFLIVDKSGKEELVTCGWNLIDLERGNHMEFFSAET